MNFGVFDGVVGDDGEEERPERREAMPFAWGTSGAQSFIFFKNFISC
jgi:hypothetical protein